MQEMSLEVALSLSTTLLITINSAEVARTEITKIITTETPDVMSSVDQLL